MANSAQAKKRARQAEKHRQHNVSRRSNMRTFLKRVIKAIAEGNKTLALSEYRLATSVLDKMATAGLIHKNKAARHKSRLNGHIKAIPAA